MEITPAKQNAWRLGVKYLKLKVNSWSGEGDITRKTMLYGKKWSNINMAKLNYGAQILLQIHLVCGEWSTIRAFWLALKVKVQSTGWALQIQGALQALFPRLFSICTNREVKVQEIWSPLEAGRVAPTKVKCFTWLVVRRACWLIKHYRKRVSTLLQDAHYVRRL